ncbi:MAG: hypothetical protein K6A43_08085 [Treponema sp.]|nr:hypothetical protein [Treponema sp.]
MHISEIDKKDYPNRIKKLLEYLTQGLYGQEYVIKQLVLFSYAYGKIELKGNDVLLQNEICDRVKYALQMISPLDPKTVPYNKSGFVKEIDVPEIAESNFFDFITADFPMLETTDEQKNLRLTSSEVSMLQTESQKVRLSDGVKRLILFNRTEYVDTKWQGIVHILQVSALLNGRDTVYLSDISNIFVKDLFPIINMDDYWGEEDYNRNLFDDYEDYLASIKRHQRKLELMEPLYTLISSLYETIELCSKEVQKSTVVSKLSSEVQNRTSLILNEIEKRFYELESYRKELDITNIFSRKSDIEEQLSIINKEIKNLEDVKEMILKKVKFQSSAD